MKKEILLNSVILVLICLTFVSATIVNEGESITIQDKDNNDLILVLTAVYSQTSAEISIDGTPFTIGEEYYEDLSNVELFVNDIFYTSKEAGLSGVNLNNYAVVYEDKASNGEYVFFGDDNDEYSFDMEVLSAEEANLIVDGESVSFGEKDYGEIQGASFYVVDIFHTTKETGISAVSLGFFEGGIGFGNKENLNSCQIAGYYCVESSFNCLENGGNVLAPELYSCSGAGRACCTVDVDVGEGCIDSDGLDYYTKGTASGKHWTQDSGWTYMTKTDYCWERSSLEPTNVGRYAIDFNCQVNSRPLASDGKESLFPSGERLVGSIYLCPNGCLDGACAGSSNEVSSESYEDESNVVSSEAAGQNNFVCGSCGLDNKCYPLGYRKDGSYCAESGEFVFQLSSDGLCENNFECESNVCVSGECVSGSLLTKVIAWFKRMFG
ncbi:MAG: hypothetical protein KJ600_01085 [Nanoarchaeota archaeon]|nr:hypothetical protein [Nanoarchaeota archaeon]MBU1103136.1 hypothetical protein [Nanoarchaeota archaeon]